MLQLEVVKRYSGVHQILGRLRSRDVVQDSAIFEDPFTDEIFHVTTSGENEAVYTIGSLYFVIGMKVGQHVSDLFSIVVMYSFMYRTILAFLNSKRL